MPQGIDEDYDGTPDEMQQDGPGKLMELLVKLKGMLGEVLGDASDPGPDLGEPGGEALPMPAHGPTGEEGMMMEEMGASAPPAPAPGAGPLKAKLQSLKTARGR